MVPVTLIQAGPCTVSQVKTADSDGYNSVQLAFGKKSKRNTNKPAAGHLKKAGIESAKTIAEFKSVDGFDYELGQKFDSSIFLIYPDGSYFSGAKGIFKALAISTNKLPLWAYENVPGFAPISEFIYRGIAANRQIFNLLTRWI